MTFLLRRVRRALGVCGSRRTLAVAASLSMACAALAAPREARAYCRTTTTPIPANYSPTRGCFKDGLVLYWKGACVGYSVNSHATASTPLSTATSVINQAFTAWNDVTCAGPVGIRASNVGAVDCAEVRYNPNGPNQNVIIFRDRGWPYSDPNNTLGLTTVTFNADTGEIYDADMELNATGGNLSTSSVVPANGFDLLSVVTHEAGHFLGLAHATDSSATMYASYKPGTSALRTLAADDVAGICDIYPTATTRTVDKSVAVSGLEVADSCDPVPRHGFGTTCAANPGPSDSSSSGGCSVAASPSGDHDAPRAAWLALAVGFGLAVVRRRKHG